MIDKNETIPCRLTEKNKKIKIQERGTNNDPEQVRSQLDQRDGRDDLP
jgi:hypothetical protein